MDLGRVFDRNRAGCDQGTVEEVILRLGQVVTRLPPLPGAETTILARAMKVTTSRVGDPSVAYRKVEAKKLLAEYVVDLPFRHGRLLSSEGGILLEAVEDVFLRAQLGGTAAPSSAQRRRRLRLLRQLQLPRLRRPCQTKSWRGGPRAKLTSVAGL